MFSVKRRRKKDEEKEEEEEEEEAYGSFMLGNTTAKTQ
jgi:hypothetical protein